MTRSTNTPGRASLSGATSASPALRWPDDYLPLLLLPLDGSLASLTALTVARNLAEVLGSMLRLLYVATEEPLAEREVLRRLGLSKRDLHGAVLDCQPGEPRRVILDAAHQSRAQMVAVGFTRSPEGQRGFGRIAESLMHYGPSPVLLVRLGAGGRLARLGGRMRRLLLPLDGAPSTAARITPAVVLAQQAGAELDVLHVAGRGIRRPQEPGTLTAPSYVDQPQHEWPFWAREFVDRFCHVLAHCPGSVLTRLMLGTGVPARAILTHARRHESDLIVLEWRGRKDVRYTATARNVVAHADCPVLLIRAISGPGAAVAEEG